jgi:hypothetical protein
VPSMRLRVGGAGGGAAAVAFPGTAAHSRNGWVPLCNAVANSLFGKKFPVFGGAGNWPQAVESTRRPALKTGQRGWNRPKFARIPC